MHQRISLEDAALLSSLVTEGGVAAAARALGLPKSTVSRRLRALEEQMGVPLFLVREGALRPTEAGLRFAERFARVIEEAELTHRHIADAASHSGRSMRILAHALIGTQILGDLIADFLGRHLDVTAEVEVVDELPDDLDERFDVVLRLDAMTPDPSAIMRRLGGIEQVLCAAPELLAAHGVPRAPEDLARTPSVAHGEGRTTAVFTLRLGAESKTISCPARLTVNHANAVYRAVLAGVGIGALPWPLVRADLQSGHLVRLFPQASLPELSLYALVPSRRQLRPAVRALLADFSDSLRGMAGPGPERTS